MDHIIRVRCYIFIAIIILLLPGCAPGPIFTFKNAIGEKSELWGGYTYQGVYSLQQDVFIREGSIFTSKQLLHDAKILVPPTMVKQGGLYSAPESIKIFNANPEKYPSVIGVVKSGTNISCSKIIEYTPVGYRNSLYIYATILDGQFEGNLVEISDLSLFHSKSAKDIHLKMPNKAFLSLVNESIK